MKDLLDRIKAASDKASQRDKEIGASFNMRGDAYVLINYPEHFKNYRLWSKGQIEDLSLDDESIQDYEIGLYEGLCNESIHSIMKQDEKSDS